MLGVLQGFTVIGVIVLVGAIIGRTGWLGSTGQQGLTKLAFYVATPALMFQLLSEARLEILFSHQFTVTAIAMTCMAAVYGVIAGFRKWGLGAGAVGAMASSYVNTGNLGIPIAVYVLGDATLVAPVTLLQQLIVTPVMMALLDIGSRSADAPRLRFHDYLLRPFRNPIVIGSLSGLALSALRIEVPDFIMDPIGLIGGMSVPAVLLAFGMSMRNNSVPLRGPERGQVLTATILKSIVHPVAAWALAVFAFGITGQTLLAVVVTAALPAAQNIFTYSSQFGVGERLARESILLTTLLSVPAVFAATLLVHP